MTRAELNAKVDAFVTKYNGQSNIGTNDSNKGECVGLCNVFWKEIWGILYPLKGANTAYEIWSKATNTRPDLFQKVKVGTKLPSKGDVIIWKDLAGGAGHCGIYLEHITAGFISLDQNWSPKKVTKVKHSWKDVVGYIHNLTEEATDPCASVKKELTSTKGLLTKANNKNAELESANNKLNDDLDSCQIQVYSLNERLAECQNHAYTWSEIWQIIINKIKGSK